MMIFCTTCKKKTRHRFEKGSFASIAKCDVCLKNGFYDRLRGGC